MSKTIVKAATATITIGGAEIGITNLTFGKQFEEIEAFDTKSEDILGGKVTRPVNFTYSKDVQVANLGLNTSLAATFKFEDVAGNDTTWAGNIILLSESNNASAPSGVLEVSVDGRFTADYSETQTAAT